MVRLEFQHISVDGWSLLASILPKGRQEVPAPSTE